MGNNSRFLLVCSTWRLWAGAALLGEIGPVIGWPILLGLSLIISNFWAYRAGEWKNAKGPFNKLLAGLVVF